MAEVHTLTTIEVRNHGLKCPYNEDARALLALGERAIQRAIAAEEDDALRSEVRHAIEQIEGAHVTLLGKRKFTRPEPADAKTNPSLLQASDPRLRRLWDLCGVLHAVVPNPDPVFGSDDKVERWIDHPTEGATRTLPVVLAALRETVVSFGFDAMNDVEVKARVDLWDRNTQMARRQAQ